MSTQKESGTAEHPWQLKTPPGSSQYQAYREPEAEPPALVVQVGKTQLRYHLRAIEDLHAMLMKHGDWMLLGSADEQKAAAQGRSGIFVMFRTSRRTQSTSRCRRPSCR